MKVGQRLVVMAHDVVSQTSVDPSVRIVRFRLYRSVVALNRLLEVTLFKVLVAFLPVGFARLGQCDYPLSPKALLN